jgi:hypothetical protein
MHEKLIMTKAKQFSVGMAKYYYGKHHNAPSSCGASNDDITHTLPHNKMFESPTMKPTIPMDSIRVVALPV